MGPMEHRFIVDEHGRRTAVVLDIADYQQLLDDLEELEAIRAYDAASAARDAVIPFAQATEDIEASATESR